MSDNLTLYNKVREVPAKAQKEITGGRLSGMTDINPMWRIKTLTEQFGICGEGWKYEITNQRLEPGGDNQIAAFVDINLYYKQGDGWSEPIPGSGGSMFVAKESKGLYTDDECFKKALTDALGVACKALGVGADVYWQKDKTKYNGVTEQAPVTKKKVEKETLDIIADRAEQVGVSTDEVKKMMKEMFGVNRGLDMTVEQAAELDAKLIERLEGANA